MNTINLNTEEVVAVVLCIYNAIDQKRKDIEKFEEYASYGLDDENNRAAIADLKSEIAELKAVVKKFN